MTQETGIAAPAPAAQPYFAGLPAPDSPDFDSLCRFCEEHRIAVLGSLPWVAAELAALGGFATMLRLVRGHGGRRLYLPRERDACSGRLGVSLDGATHRRLLDRASAAGTIEIPSAWGVFVGLRRVAIRAAVRAGRSQREVAQAFGVTERHLRREADSIQAGSIQAGSIQAGLARSGAAQTSPAHTGRARTDLAPARLRGQTGFEPPAPRPPTRKN